jgi:hypothetical protein
VSVLLLGRLVQNFGNEKAALKAAKTRTSETGVRYRIMMIETALPTRRREVLAIDMSSVLRPTWASVNPSEEINGKLPRIRPMAPLKAGTTRGLFGPVLEFFQGSHTEQGCSGEHDDENHGTK